MRAALAVLPLLLLAGSGPTSVAEPWARASAAPAAVPIYTKNRPPRAPRQLPRRTSVSKDGITWTFARPAPVGRFVTGDSYVVGPVTVTAISPAPANGKNGSVKNVPAEDDETGFDSRTEANRYESDLSVRLPVSLAPGDWLVSSISLDRVGSSPAVALRQVERQPGSVDLDPHERAPAAAAGCVQALLRRPGLVIGTGCRCFPQREAWDNFATNMWRAYRVRG